MALETKGGGASLTWWVGCDAVEGPVCWRSLVGWMEGLCYGPHAGKEHWASRRRALTSLLGPLARDTNPAINEPSGACPPNSPNSLWCCQVRTAALSSASVEAANSGAHRIQSRAGYSILRTAPYRVVVTMRTRSFPPLPSSLPTASKQPPRPPFCRRGQGPAKPRR